MFYVFGISINIFLLLLLLSKKHKTLADKVLAAWLIIICGHLLLYEQGHKLLDIRYAHLLGITSPYPLLHGPMLYLYTGAMTNQLPANRKRLWLHFLPVLATYIYRSPFILLLSAREKLDVFLAHGKGYEMYTLLNTYAIKISGIAYVIWSLVLLHKHQRQIANQFSYDEKINLNWLRYLILGVAIVWVFVIAEANNDSIFLAVVVFVVLLGYFGIRQGRIYNYSSGQVLPGNVATQPYTGTALMEEDNKVTEVDKPVSAAAGAWPGRLTSNEPTAEPTAVKKKYAKSGLSAEAAHALHLRLTEIMAAQKLYTDPELSLVLLAAKLGIHPNYLSQVINTMENKSFYDYVNSLRIEAFKSLLLVPGNEKFTIMSLAYDCGFNSKSSFNKNFRKITGQSPSEYLQSLGSKTAVPENDA